MSRPRSARSSAAAPARGAARGVYVATPKSDIYVVMLAVSLSAMFIGALLFVLILARYDFKTKVSALFPSERPASVALALGEELPTILRS